LIRLTANAAYAVAATSGIILWLATTAISGRREAWDASLYWMAAYPLGLIIAGILGYLVPERPWRWALTLMLTQAVTLAAGAADFGLLPLGLIMFSVLSLPLILAAKLASTVGRRRESRGTRSSGGLDGGR
jgi:multisubunit Na+/H+ antiporter MnhB subunit